MKVERNRPFGFRHQFRSERVCSKICARPPSRHAPAWTGKWKLFKKALMRKPFFGNCLRRNWPHLTFSEWKEIDAALQVWLAFGCMNIRSRPQNQHGAVPQPVADESQALKHYRCDEAVQQVRCANKNLSEANFNISPASIRGHSHHRKVARNSALSSSMAEGTGLVDNTSFKTACCRSFVEPYPGEKIRHRLSQKDSFVVLCLIQKGWKAKETNFC